MTAIDANGKMAEQVYTSKENATLIITQAFEQLHQTIEERKNTLLSEMEAISISTTTALTLQKEQLMKMQDEIGRYTDMTSHILQTHSDHEMAALGDQLATEFKATLKKVENVSLTPNQSSDIDVSLLHIDSLINQLSIFGDVMDSASPSQSTWSSESVAKVKERYCVKVESMTSKGERYPYGGPQVEDHGDGTYTITLTPQTAGPHQLLITMDGQHVQNSPCDLDVGSKYSTLCNPEQVIKCSGRPHGIAIHDSGDIDVACFGDHCIRVFDQAGQQRRTIGRCGSGDGQFASPCGLFIKGDVMYVADYYNNRIQKLTTGGQFLQSFGQRGSGQGQFQYPVSVIVDQRDRLIVSDKSNDRVVILDQAGTWLLTINGNVPGSHGFQDPLGVALDSQGNIHVAALCSYTIKVFTPEGTYVRSYGDVNAASGIVIDEEGYSLVTEYSGDCLSIFDSQGHKVHTVGNLNGPNGVMLDPKSTSGSVRDILFDEANRRIPDDKLTLYCEVSVVSDVVNQSGTSVMSNSPKVPECNLSSDLACLLEDGQFSDVMLAVEYHEFKAHKAVLAGLLYSVPHEMEESRKNRVEISDLDQEVMQEMLAYIYTGKALNLRRWADSLLSAADKILCLEMCLC
eukprot:Em0024g225a